MFETFIIQPIFNMLLILHAAVGDFGAAIILFTIIVRLIMWPLLRKQLHHGKKLRQIQPQIKEIRAKYKTKPQEQSQALMNLYKEHEVNPLGSFGLLFIQLPVFIGLFSALRSVIDNPERMIRLPYGFVADNHVVSDMVNSVADKTNQAIAGLENQELATQIIDRFGGSVTAEGLHNMSAESLNQLYNSELVTQTVSGVETLVHGPFFDQHLFGFIDLSGRAISNGSIYIPVMIIAILAGIFQYFQTKQLAPDDGKPKKTIRQIMREAAKEGKEPDQSEISAAMSKRMGLFFAPLITLISATSPSGLALYFASSGLVGLLQQRRVLGEDLEEMEMVADVSEVKPKKKSNENKQTKKPTAKNKKTTTKKSKKGK